MSREGGSRRAAGNSKEPWVGHLVTHSLLRYASLFWIEHFRHILSSAGWICRKLANVQVSGWRNLPCRTLLFGLHRDSGSVVWQQGHYPRSRQSYILGLMLLFWKASLSSSDKCLRGQWGGIVSVVPSRLKVCANYTAPCRGRWLPHVVRTRSRYNEIRSSG